MYVNNLSKSKLAEKALGVGSLSLQDTLGMHSMTVGGFRWAVEENGTCDCSLTSASPPVRAVQIDRQQGFSGD
jgi:hypothetical protein